MHVHVYLAGEQDMHGHMATKLGLKLTQILRLGPTDANAGSAHQRSPAGQALTLLMFNGVVPAANSDHTGCLWLGIRCSSMLPEASCD